MKKLINITLLFALIVLVSSCASKKKLETVRLELDDITNDYRRSQTQLDDCNIKYTRAMGETESLKIQLSSRSDQIQDLKDQIYYSMNSTHFIMNLVQTKEQN